MTPSPLPPRIVIRGVRDIVVSVPHLLGFVPGTSLVLVGLDPDSTVVVTLRVDLPWAGMPAAERATMLDHWAESFSVLGREGIGEAVVAVYPAEPDADDGRWPLMLGLPHHDLVKDLRELLAVEGVQLRDALCVVGDRFRSYLCDDPGCCPPEGQQLDASQRARVEAVFVASGSAPLPSRAALEAALDPRPYDDAFMRGIARARDGILVRQHGDVVKRVDDFVRDVGRWGERPGSTSMITRLVVVGSLLVGDIRSRDLLLKRLTARPSRDLLAAARQVLGEVVRCAQGTDAAQPAATLAVCAWAAGDGAAARVAVVRALEADPSCSLALLVEEALDRGLRPTVWTESIGALSDEEILGGARRGQERSPA